MRKVDSTLQERCSLTEYSCDLFHSGVQESTKGETWDEIKKVYDL